MSNVRFQTCLLLICTLASVCLAEPKTISIPKYQSDMPDGEGREVFAANCAACHTAGYIAMQPPMSAEKWKESVTKMQKTFGAPIPDDDIPQIVDYIMAAKEGQGPKIRPLPVVPPPGNTPTLPSSDPAQRAKDIERGQAVFSSICAPCHGTEARGDGPAGLALLPKPRDITATHFADQALADAVCNGVTGTAMLAFDPTLPKDDLRAVITYALTLAPADDTPPPAPTPETKALYLQHCASCHGATGGADGIASATLPRPAANFHLKRPTHEFALSAISDGIPGTTMPPWKSKLSDAQREALAHYIRTFYDAGKSK